jgi:hypothetical protein
LGDFEPKHQQLAMDSRSAPPRVLPADPPDQLPQPAINPRPPSLRDFQCQKRTKSRAVPSQDRLRLNNPINLKQARPQPGHQHEKKAITVTKPRTCFAQSDIELMPKSQILGEVHKADDDSMGRNPEARKAA